MIDRDKVIRAFEQYVYNFVELTTTDEYNHQILEQVLALLKEQDKIIQNILLEKANELNDKATILQIEAQKREIRRLLEQK